MGVSPYRVSSALCWMFSDGMDNISKLIFAFVVLILKVDGANTVGDFRPISLLNVVYTIITKILTTRLNAILDNLVDKAHSGFIKGRYIMDEVSVA